MLFAIKKREYLKNRNFDNNFDIMISFLYTKQN